MMSWRRTASFGWRTGFVLGVVLGFQDGFMGSVLPPGAHQVVSPISTPAELVRAFAQPLLAEILLWGGLCIAAALLVRWLSGLIAPQILAPDRFVPLFAGSATAVAVGLLALTTFSSNLSPLRLFTPPRAYFNVRVLIVAALVGLGVGYLIRFLRRQPSFPRFKGFLVSILFWLVIFTPIVLWLNRSYLEYGFKPVFIGVMAFIVLLLSVLTWVGGRFFATRIFQQPPRSLLSRFQTLPPLILVLMAVLGSVPREKTVEWSLGAGKGPLDRNVILISVDTLRRDRLSPYVEDGCHTPHVQRLADEGVVFENAQSTAPWTFPSVCSLLTGLYPSAHGVTKMMSRLDEMRETLAEGVSRGGYITAAVVSNTWLRKQFGMSQGFQVYDHMKDRLGHRRENKSLWFKLVGSLLPEKGGWSDPSDAAMHVSYAIDMIERIGDRNFFFWLHIIDPHDPYVARGEWREEAGVEYPSTVFPRFTSGKIVDLRRGKLLDRNDRGHVEDLYNRETEYSDTQVGRFLEKVYELGLTRNTLILFTSDHGEELWDHNNVYHGHTFFTELTGVPLIVRPPDDFPLSARRISAQVRLIDLAPTVLDFLGMPNLPSAQGETLLPLIRGDVEAVHRPAFYESVLHFADRTGVCDGRYKYILCESTGEEELYDLEDDPGESYNIADRMPDKRLELKGMLLAHNDEQRRINKSLGSSEGSTALDEETLEDLRALGYIQ